MKKSNRKLSLRQKALIAEQPSQEPRDLAAEVRVAFQQYDKGEPIVFKANKQVQWRADWKSPAKP
jgi:hypothetical protein